MEMMEMMEWKEERTEPTAAGKSLREDMAEAGFGRHKTGGKCWMEKAKSDERLARHRNGTDKSVNMEFAWERMMEMVEAEWMQGRTLTRKRKRNRKGLEPEGMRTSSAMAEAAKLPEM